MLFTKTGLNIAAGYVRVVHGGRGDYVELRPDQIYPSYVHMPSNQEWRQTHDKAFYLEYRTNDTAYVKIYYQKRTVSYADYKVGMCYISPDDLRMAANNQLVPFTEVI